jgi:hypothetical protein
MTDDINVAAGAYQHLNSIRPEQAVADSNGRTHPSTSTGAEPWAGPTTSVGLRP